MNTMNDYDCKFIHQDPEQEEEDMHSEALTLIEQAKKKSQVLHY